MVFVICQGLDINYVLDLDLDSFRSLSNSCKRVLSVLRYRRLLDNQMAANGSGKELTRYIKEAIEPEMKIGHRPVNDLDKALKVFGKGF